MSNTLTNLIPDIYNAFDTVNREMVGFIPSATRNSTAERAAVGQAVTWPLSTPGTGFDVTPSNVVPNTTGIAPAVETMTITKSKGYEFGVTGEEERSIGTPGVGWGVIQANAIAEAIRSLTNEMEADLALAARLAAGRATGTAGTTPFGSGSLADMANVEQILNDNGAPMADRSLILNSTAAAAFKTINNLTRANESGSTMTLRTGELMDIYNFSVKATGQAASLRHTAGTAAGSTTNTTGYAVGATTITLASAGTGAILAGDVITFAGDTNRYVVTAGDAAVNGGGTITIAKPGLQQALPASAVAITVVGDSYSSVALQAGALHLATRAPIRPSDGDLVSEVMTLTDPFSGISFEFAKYPMYRKVRYEVAAAWGVRAWKPENIALLLG